MERNQTFESPESVEQLIRNAALHLQREGLTMKEAESSLVQRGVPQVAAAYFIAEIAAENAQLRRSGSTNVKRGSLATFIGAGLTASSYAAAEPGETYVVFYGAVIVGVIWLAIGLAQYALSRRKWLPSTGVAAYASDANYKRAGERHDWRKFM